MQRNLTMAEEAASNSVEQRWQTDAALRAEFGDDKAACLAYFRAEARGATKEFGGGVVHVRAKGRE